MYQTISIAIEKDNGGDDIASRKPCWPIRADGGEADGGKDVIVIHLKCGIPHDLEPVDNRFNGGKRIEVCVCCDLLVGRDVITMPIEQPDKGFINKLGKYWWIEYGLPHSG